MSWTTGAPECPCRLRERGSSTRAHRRCVHRTPSHAHESRSLRKGAGHDQDDVGAITYAGPGRDRHGECALARNTTQERPSSRVMSWLPILKLVLTRRYADLAAMEGVVRGSGLDWTIVRTPRLVNKPATGRYRVAHVQRPRWSADLARRRGVAHARCPSSARDDRGDRRRRLLTESTHCQEC